MSIYIPSIVSDAWPKGATPTNIMEAFQATGIFPFNQDVFEDDDYAPSFVTDQPEKILHPILLCNLLHLSKSLNLLKLSHLQHNHCNLMLHFHIAFLLSNLMSHLHNLFQLRVLLPHLHNLIQMSSPMQHLHNLSQLSSLMSFNRF